LLHPPFAATVVPNPVRNADAISSFTNSLILNVTLSWIRVYYFPTCDRGEC